MKIVHIVYSGIGGAGSICLSLFKEDLKYTNYSSKIIFTGPSFSQIIEKKIKKNKFFFVKTIKYLQFLSWFNIFIKLIKVRPDIIYLHNYQIVPCLLYSLFFKIKLIYIDHAALNYKTFRDRFIAHLIKIFKIHTVVLNKENFNFFIKHNINKKNIHLILNGIDHYFFKKKKRKKKKFFVLGMAGRLDYFKRQDILIKVLSNKKICNLNLKLSLAGDGPEIENLSRLALQHKVKSKVVFKGFLNDKQLKIGLTILIYMFMHHLVKECPLLYCTQCQWKYLLLPQMFMELKIFLGCVLKLDICLIIMIMIKFQI